MAPSTLEMAARASSPPSRHFGEEEESSLKRPGNGLTCEVRKKVHELIYEMQWTSNVTFTSSMAFWACGLLAKQAITEAAECETPSLELPSSWTRHCKWSSVGSEAVSANDEGIRKHVAAQILYFIYFIFRPQFHDIWVLHLEQV